jgi:hypothetical protein
MYHHLLDKIKQEKPEWKASLVKNTLLVVALLLEEKTVSLWKLKGSVGKLLGNTQTDSRSHYQRLKRWLKEGEKGKGLWVEMLRAAVSLLSKESVCLILDGSSWKWGGKEYHFLTLSLLYKGVSVPIFWMELSRLGISSQIVPATKLHVSDWHRRWLLRMACKLFSLKGKVLLADREYIGNEWFNILKEKGMDFVIRLRKGNYEQQIEQGGKKITKLESKARAKVGRVVWQNFTLQGHCYTYVLKAYRERSGKIALLRLISSLAADKALQYYMERYRIEPMFRHLKSNGFHLASLHVQKSYKVQLMMAAVVLAYCLSVVYGLKKYKHRIAVKKHASREMSVFRWGLDKWQNHLQTFVHFLDKLSVYYKLWNSQENTLLKLHVP